MHIPKYYKSEDDLNKFYYQLKQIQCPYCLLIGYLILHGYLRGYDETDFQNRIIRGRRIFCSNRNRRGGCGRTFSILKSFILKHFTLTAYTLWHFLDNLAKGMSKLAAFRETKIPSADSTIYWLYKLFCNSQSQIRTKLLQRTSSPLFEGDHALQTISHLKKVFRNSESPVSAYQNHFQTSFLAV